MSYHGPKTRNILLDEYKTIRNLDTFQIKIKKRASFFKKRVFPCRLCKVYIDGVGFL